MSKRHEVTFVSAGRKAQCPSDPAYPNGKKIDCTGGVFPQCFVRLPYPAPECGQFFVKCNDCALTVIVTAAGRPDDPVSVSVACKTSSVN